MSGHWKKSLKPRLLAAVTLFPLLPGCIYAEWRCVQCYEGPKSSMDAVSVVLAQNNGFVRIKEIDGRGVPYAVEFHLSPGTHSLVTGAPFFAKANGPLPTLCTLEAGRVYELHVDDMTVEARNKPLDPRSATIGWDVRLEELGPYATLTQSPYVHPDLYHFCHGRFTFGAWVVAATTPFLVVETPPPHWGRVQNWRFRTLAGNWPDWPDAWCVRDDGTYEPCTNDPEIRKWLGLKD